MAASQRATSSGSECDRRNENVTIDERKRKRMESNRESARRSRLRKRKQLDDLIGQASQLQNANSQLVQSIDAANHKFVEVESANNVLKAQVMELTLRLRSLNSVLEMLKEVSGCAIDIPEIPESLMNPWQLPCPNQPIVASAEMFHY